MRHSFRIKIGVVTRARDFLYAKTRRSGWVFEKGNVLTTPMFLIDKASQRCGATTMGMHSRALFGRSIVSRAQ